MITLEPRSYVPDDEIDLRELGRTLWRNRLLITAVTAGAALATAAASAFALPSRYEAKALLIVTGGSSANAGAPISGAKGRRRPERRNCSKA